MKSWRSMKIMTEKINSASFSCRLPEHKSSLAIELEENDRWRLPNEGFVLFI